MLPVTDIFSRTKTWPGQVPRLDSQLIGPQKVEDFERFNVLSQPILTARSVVDGLGLPFSQEQEWVRFLQREVVGQGNELAFRKAVVVKAQADNLDPVVRNLINLRSLKYYRGIKKSLPIFVLQKALPRGGSYYRRVPKKNGKGYNYYYNQETYDRSRGAHLGGEDTSNGYLSNKIKNILTNAGSNGNGSLFKNLVKKYGLDKIVNVMEDVRKKGNLKVNNGKFYWQEKEEK